MTTGTVEVWHSEEGWGEIVLDDGRRVFAHFSHILEMEGYRELVPDQRVEIEVEEAGQDGFDWRAVELRRIP